MNEKTQRNENKMKMKKKKKKKKKKQITNTIILPPSFFKSFCSSSYKTNKQPHTHTHSED